MTSAIYPAVLANIDTGEYRAARTPLRVFDKSDRQMIEVNFDHCEKSGSFTLRHKPVGEVWAEVKYGAV